jgi:hypothetical protein
VSRISLNFYAILRTWRKRGDMNYGDPFRIRSRETFSAEERKETFLNFECFPNESEKFDFLIYYRIEYFWNIFYGDTWCDGEKKNRKKLSKLGLQSTFLIMKYTQRQRILRVRFFHASLLKEQRGRR